MITFKSAKEVDGFFSTVVTELSRKVPYKTTISISATISFELRKQGVILNGTDYLKPAKLYDVLSNGCSNNLAKARLKSYGITPKELKFKNEILFACQTSSK